MPTPTNIVGKNNEVAGVQEGALVVTNIPVPASTDSDLIIVPLVINVSVDGAGVVFDLNLDGSSTPIDALIQADSDGDIYIKTINIIIEDTGNIFLEDFGGIAGGLSNGIDTFIEARGVRFPISKRPLFTNFDMVRVGTLTPPVGADDTAFRIKQRQGSGDTLYNPVWDMTRLSSGDLGIRLAANTNQKIGITINDNLTSLVSFNMVMTGFKRLI